MKARPQSVLSHSAFLVGLAAFLTALLVQSGELGSIDSVIRLQTTHSFWTSAPPVPDNSIDFGVKGKNGQIYATYGMGQSLLMLPSDVVGTYLARLRLFCGFAAHDPGIRQIVVSYSTSVLVCVLSILLCIRCLCLLEFTANQVIAGAFTLLFGTTFLHYTQNMMENSLLLLLTLTGLTFQYDWLRTSRIWSLAIGSLALGANLLVRLTAALDITGAALFVLLVLWSKQIRGRELLAQLGCYVRVAGPIYSVFLVLDRLYQYHRFGSFFNTYLTVLAMQQRKLDPGLPPDFPWNTPLREGLLGPLITPEKSVFLFDPLIVLTLLLSILLWKRFRVDIKAFLVAALSLLALYIFFYAKYDDWSGDFAWGDRFITTPVEILGMVSIPLLLRHRPDLGKIVWQLGMAIAIVSVAIQLASVAFWHPLEIHQMETLGHPTFVVGLRFKNIVAVTLGKADEWGLSNEDTRVGGIRSNTLYFLPFLLKKDGSISKTIADGLIAAWLVALATLVAVLLFIQRNARRGDFDVRCTPGAALGHQGRVTLARN
jgi:hypothetical protein